MKRFRTFVALVLVFLFVPGAVEATENLVHLMAHGDLAHQSHANAHSDAGTEHDCSGLFHSCLCHATVLVTVPPMGTQLPTPPPRIGPKLNTSMDRTTMGFPDQLYRPPIV